MQTDHEIDRLLHRVAQGDEQAAATLLARHRQRLRRMVAIRLDDRVTSRVDPSDVIQEALVEAVKRLPAYAKRQPIPFYPWLRSLTLEKVAKAHRHHIHAQKRSVSQEEPPQWELSQASQDRLANQLPQSQTSVAGVAMREELRGQVRSALARLPNHHREILVLLFLERLSTSEAAAVLGTSTDAVRSRQLRALEHFGRLIRPLMGEQS